MLARVSVQAPVATERARFRDLVASPEFTVVMASRVVSMLGTMVAQVGMSVLVYQRTGSPAMSALTFTVGFVPYLLGGVLFGGATDRWPVRRTLVLCEVLGGVLFLVASLPGIPAWGLLALAFGEGLVAPVFGGAQASLLPALLGGGPRYVLGRASLRIIAQGAQLVGLAGGGVLLAAIGARSALLLDAVSFFVSAAVLRAGLRAHRPVRAAAGSLVRDSLRGLRAVLSHRATRRLLLFRWLVPTCGLAPEALAVPYVAATHGSHRMLGLYMAAIPAAMVLADLVAGRLLGPAAQSRLVVPGAAVTAAPLLGFLAEPPPQVAVGLLVLVGLGYCHGLAVDAKLLRAAPADLLSRALAVDQAGLMFLQGLGFGIWGLAGQLLPLGVAIALAGCCGLTVVTVWAATAGRRPPGRRDPARP